MAVGKIVNRAWMSTATAGTGTITLGSALSGYQTFGDAGVANADVVSYTIIDGAAWEIGTGTYTSAGTTMTRSVDESSNADAALNLSGSASVFITVRAVDIRPASTTDNTVPRFDGTVGSFQTSGVTIDDSDNLTTAGAVSGASAAGNMVATQANQETATSTTTLVSPGRQQFHPSAAKCWAIVNMAGTVSAGYNVDSVTDTGTGIATITIGTDFSTANYSVVCSAVQGTAAAEYNTKISSQSAGSVVIRCYVTNDTLADPDSLTFAAFGDQ